MVQNPEALSERHLVVLAEADPGTPAPGIERLAGHPDLLRDLQRLPTTLYGGLPPCRELTIAGAFEHDRQARTRAHQLEVLGVESRVTEAGRYLGPQDEVRAWCERTPVPRGPQRCGELRFAERHGDQTWLWLGLDEDATGAALQGLADPVPFGDPGTWQSPLRTDAVGGHRKGERWRVYAPASGRAVGTGRITGFAALTRGEPHLSQVAGEAADAAPLCGRPEIFARLDGKSAPDEPLVALRTGGAEPTLYTALAPLRDVELEDEVKATVAQAPAFSQAFARASALASERSAPLQQLVALTGFVARGRKVLLVRIALQTGDGVSWCGHDDVRVELAGVYAWDQDGRVGAPLFPLHALERTEILGLLDLEGDGIPELFERAWPGALRLQRAEAEPACALERGYCASPCG